MNSSDSSSYYYTAPRLLEDKRNERQHEHLSQRREIDPNAQTTGNASAIGAKHRSFPCSRCGFHFKRDSYRVRHIEEDVCRLCICGLWFKNETTLNSHVKRNKQTSRSPSDTSAIRHGVSNEYRDTRSYQQSMTEVLGQYDANSTGADAPDLSGSTFNKALVQEGWDVGAEEHVEELLHGPGAEEAVQELFHGSPGGLLGQTPDDLLYASSSSWGMPAGETSSFHSEGKAAMAGIGRGLINTGASYTDSFESEDTKATWALIW